MYYIIGSAALSVIGIILLIAALAVGWSYNWNYYLPGIDACYGAGVTSSCTLNPSGTDNGLVVATLLGLGASMFLVFGAMALFGKTYNFVQGVGDIAMAPVAITKGVIGGVRGKTHHQSKKMKHSTGKKSRQH